MKINTHPTSPPLMPISSTALHPFKQISVDFITNLPPSAGFDSIMVMVDHGLMKGVIFTPCHKTIDSLGTATLLFDNVYKRFGLPDKIISDQGPQFSSITTRELNKLLGITTALSTTYHPQTNGGTK